MQHSRCQKHVGSEQPGTHPCIKIREQELKTMEKTKEQHTMQLLLFLVSNLASKAEGGKR